MSLFGVTRFVNHLFDGDCIKNHAMQYRSAILEQQGKNANHERFFRAKSLSDKSK